MLSTKTKVTVLTFSNCSNCSKLQNTSAFNYKFGLKMPFDKKL